MTGIRGGLNGDEGSEQQDTAAPLVTQGGVETKPGYFGEERESSFTSGLEKKVCSLLYLLLREQLSWGLILLFSCCSSAGNLM